MLQGFEVAQHNTAWLLEREDVRLDFEIAEPSTTPHAGPVTDSATAFVPALAPRLGTWSMTHRRRLALRFWQRAAEQGNAEASRKVGDYYYYGWVGTHAQVIDATAESNPTPTPRSTTSASASSSASAPSSSDDVSAASAPAPASAPAFASAPPPASTTVLPDYEAAADAYLLAAENRDAQAMFNMGFMYQRGLGVPRDLHLAKRYYDMTLISAPDSYVPVRMMLAQVQHRATFLFSDHASCASVRASRVAACDRSGQRVFFR